MSEEYKSDEFENDKLAGDEFSNDESDNDKLVNDVISDDESDNDKLVGEESENEKFKRKASGSKKKTPFKLSITATAVLLILSCVLTFQITYIAQAKKYEKKLNSAYGSELGLSLIDELNSIYKKNYVNSGNLDEKKLKESIIEGYIYGTGDKYATYMTADEFAEHTAKMENSAVGIGVSVIYNTENDAIEVVKVYEASPAKDAGISVGDLVTAVGGKKVSDVGYNDAVDAVKGDKGTTVTLTVKRNGETKEIDVKRDEVVIETVESKLLDGNIGYIRISNFYEKTPDEFKKAVEELQDNNAKALIFDMRGNTGGRLDAIVSVLDYLLPEGPIVRITDNSGEFETIKSDDNCVNMPMTILVNGMTASAAELFTSALMDYDKATVIGTQTYGKGTVTSAKELSDGSWVYISTELYYPPYSDNFEGIGITPDVILELPDEVKNISLYKLTYEQDTQLQKAVEILKNK